MTAGALVLLVDLGEVSARASRFRGATEVVEPRVEFPVAQGWAVDQFTPAARASSMILPTVAFGTPARGPLARYSGQPRSADAVSVGFSASGFRSGMSSRRKSASMPELRSPNGPGSSTITLKTPSTIV